MTTLFLRAVPSSSAPFLGANQAGYAGASSFITQVSGGTGLTYLFPYAPVEVQFSSIGAEYQEINRPGDYSILNRRAPKLLKASFSFRIAHRPSNGLQPINDDIELLRRMASEDATVAVVGLGSFFSGINGTGSAGGTNVTFRIYDLTITVASRSEFDNSPWQANCDVELIEDRNPVFTAAVLTPIVYAVTPSVTTATGGASGNGGGGGGSGGSGNGPPPNPDPLNWSGIAAQLAIEKAKSNPTFGTTSRAYSLAHPIGSGGGGVRLTYR